ncbi:uncharacterized protein LOC113557857 [Rhopalosiphum maidis]|uniref:uncharacterized protein LOC113557857 n=1 Tax=Rhopalosiphum maidis TaxID=43146 RepID=UPI000F0097E4|nr:uncharacterized protein LOC113557857 [Rhopalosiphum maidis]
MLSVLIFPIERSDVGFSGFENHTGKLTRGVGLGGVIGSLDSLSGFGDDLSDPFSRFPLINYFIYLIRENDHRGFRDRLMFAIVEETHIAHASAAYTYHNIRENDHRRFRDRLMFAIVEETHIAHASAAYTYHNIRENDHRGFRDRLMFVIVEETHIAHSSAP